MKAYRQLILGAVISFAACGDDDHDSVTITTSFSANVAGAPVSCATMFSNLGTTNASAALADARLFVSQVELLNDAGTWVSLQLRNNAWQSTGVALLDFEDGTGACDASGTAGTNTEVSGTAPDGVYDGVRFRVGVPFALNHNDSARAPAPLNVPGMFWNWQGGYKFVRVDWAVQEGAIPRWNVHVGSTGCDSASATNPPTEECARPNAATIELTGIDLASAIDLDLAALIAESDITVDSGGATGCQSRPDEADDCTDVFGALGLSFATGACENGCAGQTVFE